MFKNLLNKMVKLILVSSLFLIPFTVDANVNPNSDYYANTKYTQTINDFSWYLDLDHKCVKMLPGNMKFMVDKLDSGEATIYGKPIYRDEGTIHILNMTLPNGNTNWLYFASTKEACGYLEEKAKKYK